MIKFESVSKKYGYYTALQNLNLEIPAGTLYGYLGPNGAGKTTTIKILAGLLKPSSGNVYLNGINIHEKPQLAKPLFGYVPDKPYLYDKLTADELMHFIGGIYGMNKEEIRSSSNSLFEFFGITPWRTKRAEEYSQGMKQKLLIAAAFIHEPQVFIIDEPMVGLDPKNMNNLKLFLKEKADSGVTIFLSTHSLHVAEELCDRIGILNNGILIAEGTLDEIRVDAKSDGESLESLFLNLTAEEQLDE